MSEKTNESKHWWFTVDTEEAITSLKNISQTATKKTNMEYIRNALIIDAKNIEKKYDQLQSIPDIWSTHRAFDMMLFDSGINSDGVLETFKNEIIANWLAILTIIQVGEKKLGLKFKDTTITKKSIEEDKKLTGSNKILIQSMFEARPTMKLWVDEETPYNSDIVTIKSLVTGENELIPIAISSPTTLWVPAADAWKNLYEFSSDAIRGMGFIEKEPQSVNGKKTSNYHIKESFYQRLPFVALKTLATDLDSLFKKLEKMAPSKAIYDETDFIKRRIDVVKKYINTFRTEVEEYLKNGPPVRDILLDEMSYFKDFYQSDLQSVSNSVPDRLVSACFLNSKRENNCYFYMPMPLTSYGLEQLKNNKIECSVSEEEEDSNALLSSVKFIVSFKDPQIKPIDKTYKKASNLKKLDSLFISAVSIWPNVQLDGWKEYHAYRHDEIPESSMVKKYCLVPEDSVNVKEYLTKKDPVNSGKVKTPEENHWYYSFDKFPEFWKMIDDSGSNVLGYIQIKTDSKVRKNTQPVSISIDLGTTSTTIYISKDSEEGKKESPIILKGFQSSPICLSQDAANDLSTPCFVPHYLPSNKAVPFHTLLAEIKNDAQKKPDVLFGRWIYFRSITKQARAKLNIDNVEIHSNLKWSQSASEAMKLFIKEALLVTALNVRLSGHNQIKLKVSYPGAMEEVKREDYIKTVQSCAVDICKITGLTLIPFENNKTVEGITESLAVAKYMRANNLLGSNFCTIDIGGGTSDIYLCYKPKSEKLKWNGIGSSLKIGARNIFLDCFFFNNGALMDELLRAGIGDTNIDLLKKQFKIEDPDGSKRLITIAPSEEENGEVKEINLFKDATMTSSMKYSLIESLLDYSVKQTTSTTSAADILMELAMKTFDEETIYMRCRIAYYVCAIAYYAGMLARKPSTTNTTIDISQLNICFVGNGSKVLDWITSERKCTYAAIKEMFRVGMRSKGVPHAVTISDCPKHEVAKGTLEQKADIQQIVYDDIVIAGEKAIASKKRMLEETDKMPPRTSVKDYTQQFDELKTFLSAFKRVLSEELGLIMPANKGFFFRENSEDMMQANIINQLDSEKDQSIKPFFLLGVEQIDVLSREKNERG